MTRSGYGDDDGDDPLAHGRWRAQVASAIRGKRGQTLLKEMLDALDTMSEKRLIAHDLEADGQVCAIGSVGKKRGVDMSKLDPEDCDSIASTFGVAHQLVQEIEYMNDEVGPYQESPEARWVRMRQWVVSQIKASPTGDKTDA